MCRWVCVCSYIIILKKKISNTVLYCSLSAKTMRGLTGTLIFFLINSIHQRSYTYTKICLRLPWRAYQRTAEPEGWYHFHQPLPLVSSGRSVLTPQHWWHVTCWLDPVRWRKTINVKMTGTYNDFFGHKDRLTLTSVLEYLRSCN